MKKFLPLLGLILAIAIVGRSLLPPRNTGEFDIVAFGRLPILANGRIKPIDTEARTSLLRFQGRQAVRDADGHELVSSPTEWMLDMIFKPEKADNYPVFKVADPDLLSLLGQSGQSLSVQRLSLQQIWPHRAAIQEQYRAAAQIDSANRSRYQHATVDLYLNLVHYQRLEHAFVAPGRDNFLNDLMTFKEKIPAAVAAVRAKTENKPHDESLAAATMELADQFNEMAQVSNFGVIPPGQGEDPTAWKTAGAALLDSFQTGDIHPAALTYAAMAQAWRTQQPGQFNKLIELYRAGIEKRFGAELDKARAETRFNAAEPFYNGMILYGLAFFVAVFSWLVWREELGRTAFLLVGIAWVVATGGIITRMWLEGRPPVTNLYSSALFVGWGAVALCLVLEWLYHNAIGSVAAGMVGFATLLIAHQLSLSGDTLEMMRAVLDSNFWLATHVVVVTTGYASTFLAGFLALIYILRGFFTRSLDKATADALGRMVYGIVCFATLFSFVGTVLGGIWADQSWGRFWGWDPKENGALLIVIWNAIILHARWGGMIKQRGLMALAVGGNIITSWSWFGTNMLGVGLHSYGFTDAAFVGLSVFIASQLAVIGLANLPLHKWRSFAGTVPPRRRHAEPVMAK